jgi:hypothetical protein
LLSVNQRLPSGPDTMPIGWLPGVGSGKRVTLGLGGGTLTGGRVNGVVGSGSGTELDAVDFATVVVGETTVLAAVVVVDAGPETTWRGAVVVVGSTDGWTTVVVVGSSTTVGGGTSTSGSGVPAVTASATTEGTPSRSAKGIRRATATATRMTVRTGTRRRPEDTAPLSIVGSIVAMPPYSMARLSADRSSNLRPSSAARCGDAERDSDRPPGASSGCSGEVAAETRLEIGGNHHGSAPDRAAS